MHESTIELNDFQKEIWLNNYKAPSDNTIEDTFRRVANTIAAVEEDQQTRKLLQQNYYKLMSQWKFLPGGRITANAGTGREKATLYNCFVYNPQDFGITDIDSMEIIFDTLKKSAKILASEGGLGINVSYIRPNGSYIVGTGVRTPGVVKFLQMWDKASQIITMGSTKDLNDGKLPKKKIRKGAMMASLSVHHGDIKQFITAKQQSNRLSRFNLSVLISDKFMNAVQNDQMWQIGFPDTSWQSYSKLWDGNIDGWVAKKYPFVVSETLPARELWNLIMMSTYTRNEPGVLFFDTLNDYNPVKYIQTIMTTNPCLTGDTLIAVADGRNAVTIRQLSQQGRDVPVYCINNKGKLDIQYMRKIGVSGVNQDIYKVTLDNGSVIKCTGNHKFLLKDGSVKQAQNLNNGDSLYSSKKFKTTWNNIKKNNKSNSKYWMINTGNERVSEHKIVYQKLQKKKITEGFVIHHKDFDSLNNKLDNLQCMSQNNHITLHSQNMFGQKNPMNRWFKNSTKEQQDLYRQHMSQSIGGQKNGNWSGINNEQLYNIVLKYVSQELQNPITTTVYEQFAKERGLPFWGGNNKYRGKLCSLLMKINKQCGYQVYIDCNVRREYNRYIKLLNQTDLQLEFDSESNTIFCFRFCEICGKKYKLKYTQRQICVCSKECALQYKLNTDKRVDGFNNGRLVHHKNYIINKNKIDEYFISYINEYGQIPKPCIMYEFLKQNMITDFRTIRKESYQNYINTEYCERMNIDKIHTNGLNQNSQYRRQMSQKLIDGGLHYNHKVVSVQCIGKQTVYNGTVDVNHNYGIAVQQLNGSYTIIYTKNCGEIGMSSGVCNLGSLNLPRFFKDGGFDYDSFEQAIKYGVCFLDGVCDVSYIPLPQYYQKVQDFRRIGLGVTGLGSLLSMLGLKFGSYEAIKFVDQLFKFKCQIQLITSAFLGKSKGSFLKFNRQQYFSSKWWYQLPISYQIKRQIERIGYMRNAVHSDVPPSGNCQIPSSAIITEQGIKTLKEIFQQNLITSKHEEMKWYIPIKPLNVLTLQGFKRITGLYKNKTGKTLKIKTKSGNIQGTEEHKVLVKLTEDTATWKKLGQLKAGEKILFYKE